MHSGELGRALCGEEERKGRRGAPTGGSGLSVREREEEGAQREIGEAGSALACWAVEEKRRIGGGGLGRRWLSWLGWVVWFPFSISIFELNSNYLNSNQI